VYVAVDVWKALWLLGTDGRPIDAFLAGIHAVLQGDPAWVRMGAEALLRGAAPTKGLGYYEWPAFVPPHQSSTLRDRMASSPPKRGCAPGIVVTRLSPSVQGARDSACTSALLSWVPTTRHRLLGPAVCAGAGASAGAGAGAGAGASAGAGAGAGAEEAKEETDVMTPTLVPLVRSL
jgi:hypothetical protein